jgi:hypothetical protein
MNTKEKYSSQQRSPVRYLLALFVLCTLMLAAVLRMEWRYLEVRAHELAVSEHAMISCQDSEFWVMGVGFGALCIAGTLTVSGVTLLLWRRMRGRNETEAALKKANKLLDVGIRERTLELEEAKQRLEQEVLERKKTQEKQAAVIAELEQAIEKVKTFSGLLPICALCKDVRTDNGYWEKIEQYIQNHSEARFTHGICPECEKKLYPLMEKENPKGV